MHWVAPGTQEPAHAPLEHTKGQAEPDVHCPLASHVSGTLPDPLHWVAPGAQEPAHDPFTQAWLLQATGLPHWPARLHVSTPLPEHCVAPGTHEPEQAPAVQTNGHDDPDSHCPVESHV